MTNEQERELSAPPPLAKPPEPERAETAADDLDLDLESLDLTVERVEERISPSETNVFDK